MSQIFDIEKYYEHASAMFITQGWKNFVDDAKYTIGLLNDVRGIKDNKELYERQGKLDTLYYIVTFEDTLKAAYEQKLKENEDDASEDF